MVRCVTFFESHFTGVKVVLIFLKDGVATQQNSSLFSNGRTHHFSEYLISNRAESKVIFDSTTTLINGVIEMIFHYAAVSFWCNRW